MCDPPVGSTDRFEHALIYIRELVILASRQVPGFRGMIRPIRGPWPDYRLRPRRRL